MAEVFGGELGCSKVKASQLTLMFRIVLHVFLLGLITLVVSGQEIDVQADDYICWSEERRLEWEDFQGPLDSIMTYLGVLGTAGTASEIRVTPYFDGQHFNYEVRNVFNKKRSWTIVYDSLHLSHEQLHFDISELYARKIRLLLEKGKLEGLAHEELVDGVKRLLGDLNQYQNTYDRSTAHGTIDFMEEEWNEKIKNELEELKDYASTLEDCG
ncbi:DUF922 domain-containing protein [Roseivirga pacifica]|uniref:DUF922 domain-containing protein n=1 Tax=Roseivirga pacifica TaxID=1267423 RepID=UPI002094EBE8|nr:hypothetical protein [Roseivirga pacifica]MCO6357614.1 hypothetical protein [Roseivirga pacifica]MCO6365867.1 hypothetical protein [Roseivirga pacifica]MCO6371195.1 hypothetical protein [Roseivirga pacifica]MCO6375634.1 hypothetical protein [Roseivirga pacifica]MCO6378573.1 hypothetical protein [Roseivirga pacifica]